jgi:CRP/FNR family transcriptional regulator, cyclic AMP receptor protein
MKNSFSTPVKNSFWANLYKTPTEKSDIAEVLLSMPPFKKLGKNNLNLILKLIHNRVYSANEHIFYQNDPGIGLYIIIKGEILITQEIEDGERFDLATLNRGDFFGELALLDEERRSASAIAMKESQLAVIFRPDLDDFIESNLKDGVSILRGLTQIITTRLRNLNNDYFELYNNTRNK